MAVLERNRRPLQTPNSDIPDQLIATVEGLNPDQARQLANKAVDYARRSSPKLSGHSANRFAPVYGAGYYGITWIDKYVWFQERGIRPFTMTKLAGKTIPMWVKDPTGSEAAKQKDPKTRTTATGMRQTLIFRRVAHIGQRKTKKSGGETIDLGPASYPGAPGRISMRELRSPWTQPGRVGGWIVRGNVGVKWRHPGLMARDFLMYGIMRAGSEAGLVIANILPQTSGPLNKVTVPLEGRVA